MNWAQVYSAVEHGLGIAVVSIFLMLLMVWGVVTAERITEGANMGHETRSRGKPRG